MNEVLDKGKSRVSIEPFCDPFSEKFDMKRTIGLLLLLDDLRQSWYAEGRGLRDPDIRRAENETALVTYALMLQHPTGVLEELWSTFSQKPKEFSEFFSSIAQPDDIPFLIELLNEGKADPLDFTMAIGRLSFEYRGDPSYDPEILEGLSCALIKSVKDARINKVAYYHVLYAVAATGSKSAEKFVKETLDYYESREKTHKYDFDDFRFQAFAPTTGKNGIIFEQKKSDLLGALQNHNLIDPKRRELRIPEWRDRPIIDRIGPDFCLLE